MIDTVALNNILDTYFRAGTPPTNLYVGLIDLAAFTALAAGDTMASHNGWAELTSYSQSTRPQWSPTAASAGQMSNSSTMTFTTNASCSVYGIFLTTNNTKGGTSGTLIGTLPLTNSQVMPSGEDLKITLTAQAQSG